MGYALEQHFTTVKKIMQHLIRALVLGSFLLFSAAGPTLAQEATPIAAEPQAAVKEKSAEVNKAATPQEATAVAKEQAEQEKPAKPLTPAEKEAAISATDAITAYDASKVQGIAKPWQYYYQRAASPVMKKLESLHDFVFVIITIITLFVTGLIIYVCIRFSAKRNPVPSKFAHNTTVEIAWTVIPILILVAIGIPSVRAHYQYTNNQDSIDHPDMTLKIVGHQWYWSYEYPDEGVAFDSNIVPEDKLKGGQPRLLSVDNPIVVPVGKVVRVQLTSADVIHDWAMPAFGVKQDAIPGKLSETWFKAEREGIYYGQCSELCGKFHGFMPIEVHVVDQATYDAWVAGAKQKFADSNHIQLALNTN